MLGLTAITRTSRGRSEVGFSLRVGGGLSADPFLAPRLNAFLHWHQVVPVVQRDCRDLSRLHRPREHRERARLKFLFLRHGWTPETLSV